MLFSVGVLNWGTPFLKHYTTSKVKPKKPTWNGLMRSDLGKILMVNINELIIREAEILKCRFCDQRKSV